MEFPEIPVHWVVGLTKQSQYLLFSSVIRVHSRYSREIICMEPDAIN